jgi:hypothetical protein
MFPDAFEPEKTVRIERLESLQSRITVIHNECGTSMRLQNSIPIFEMPFCGGFY